MIKIIYIGRTEKVYCTSGDNKLEILAQTTRMSSMRETSVIGRVFFKIKKKMSFCQ